MKFSFSLRYLRWPGGLSISVCVSLSPPSQEHSPMFLLPFLFIIHIYSALTEILIFDGDQLEKCKDGLHTCGSRTALLLITLENKLVDVWNMLRVSGERRRFSTGESAECHLAVRLKMDSYRGEDRCVTDMTSGIKLLQSQCHTSAWTVSLHHKESQYKNIEYSSLWWRNHRLFWFHFCEDSRLNPPALMGHFVLF